MTTPRPSRRAVLQAGVLGVGGSTLGLLNRGVSPPRRIVAPAPSGLPEIQFDIARFVAPAELIDGTLFRFGPVYAGFRPGRLRRTPTRDDQRVLATALGEIEAAYPFRPEGAFVSVSYGRAYFDRLPGALVADHLPRLVSNETRPAFEEARPAPTDVSPSNPGVTKRRFTLPVQIESHDLLMTVRSDSSDIVLDILGWLAGSDRLAGRTRRSPAVTELVEWASTRLMFNRRGLPRLLANSLRLPFASRIHPDSPMWMSFADQQLDASAPADVVTFAGSPVARLTTARPDDYFALGSVQHLSHLIQDLDQFYFGETGEPDADDQETYFQRVQYMFRSTPPPARGRPDQLRDGGGPAFLPNKFLGVRDAERGARGDGTPEGVRRIGHVTALQRSSRATDGTPLHLRVDGPGFDALDVPDGSRQPKLHFSMYVPTADLFDRMRRDGAAVDLARRHGVRPSDNGLERFITATRRQNFLVPPRSVRAFPLVELV